MALQTSTLQDLRDLTFALIGREYADTTASYARINALWNQGAKMAYKKTDWWERYLVVGEPRSVLNNRIENTEDSFLVSRAGDDNANGFYPATGVDEDEHPIYIKDGNTLSFQLTSAMGHLSQHTYEWDGEYFRNTSDYPRFILTNTVSSDESWGLYNISDSGIAPVAVTSDVTRFPWDSTWTTSVEFFNVPDVYYMHRDHDDSNHWKIRKNSLSDALDTTLYEDGSAASAPNGTWDIIKAKGPAPIVDDLSTIEVLLRLHKTQPFIDKGAAEYTFFAKNSSYFVQGSSVGETAYATYKKRLDVDLATTDDVSTEIPAEFMPYMAHYAAYTWQRSVDQNSDEANFGLSLAIVNQVLEDELVKIDKQNLFNTTVARRYRTNYNSTII